MSDQTNQAVARRYLADFRNRGDMAASPRSWRRMPSATWPTSASLPGRRRYSRVGPHCCASTPTRPSPWTMRSRPPIRSWCAGPSTASILARRRRPTTGKEVVATGINIFRISNGKIAELWVESDDLGELRQLGVLPAAS